MQFKVSTIFEAMDRFTAPVRKMAGSAAYFNQRWDDAIGNFQSKWDHASRKFDRAKRLFAAGAIVTATVVGPLAACTKAYGNLATAQGEIRSLGIDAAGIDAITKAGYDFSNQWAGTSTSDFVRASYDIKSGIESLSSDAVGEFTKFAALTAVATKSQTSEMTSLFATGYGIYRNQFDSFGKDMIAGWENLSAAERDIEFGKYFSAGISGAVQTFKTDGGKMAQALQTLGAAATTQGISLADQITSLGMMQQAGLAGDAATKFKRFAERAGQAGGKLGMDFLDDENRVLGVGEIMKQMRDKFGATIDDNEAQQIKKAFGSDEAVGFVTFMIDKVDTFGEKSQHMQKTLAEGMLLTNRMAKSMQQGPNEALTVLSQKLTNVGTHIGKAVAPTFVLLADAAGWLASGVGDLVQEFPVLTAVLGGVVVIGGLLIGVGLTLASVGMAVSAATTAFIGFKAVLWALPGKFLAATAAAWKFTAALLANPITGWVVLIGAAIAAIALIIIYWDDLKAAGVGAIRWVMDAWSGFGGWAGGIKQSVQDNLLWAANKLLGAWDYVAGIPARLLNYWSGLPGWVKALAVIFSPLVALPLLIAEHWDWLMRKLQSVLAFGQKVGAAIGGVFGGSSSEASPATGGPPTPGPEVRNFGAAYRESRTVSEKREKNEITIQLKGAKGAEVTQKSTGKDIPVQKRDDVGSLQGAF